MIGNGTISISRINILTLIKSVNLCAHSPFYWDELVVARGSCLPLELLKQSHRPYRLHHVDFQFDLMRRSCDCSPFAHSQKKGMRAITGHNGYCVDRGSVELIRVYGSTIKAHQIFDSHPQCGHLCILEHVVGLGVKRMRADPDLFSSKFHNNFIPKKCKQHQKHWLGQYWFTLSSCHLCTVVSVHMQISAYYLGKQ